MYLRVSTLRSLVFCHDLAENAGLKQTEVKILPWETRIEKLAILSPVSRNLLKASLASRSWAMRWCTYRIALSGPVSREGHSAVLENVYTPIHFFLFSVFGCREACLLTQKPCPTTTQPGVRVGSRNMVARSTSRPDLYTSPDHRCSSSCCSLFKKSSPEASLYRRKSLKKNLCVHCVLRPGGLLCVCASARNVEVCMYAASVPCAVAARGFGGSVRHKGRVL